MDDQNRGLTLAVEDRRKAAHRDEVQPCEWQWGRDGDILHAGCCVYDATEAPDVCPRCKRRVEVQP